MMGDERVGGLLGSGILWLGCGHSLGAMAPRTEDECTTAPMGVESVAACGVGRVVVPVGCGVLEDGAEAVDGGGSGASLARSGVEMGGGGVWAGRGTSSDGAVGGTGGGDVARGRGTMAAVGAGGTPLS